MIFQVGKATLLRVSDVMRLKQTDIFNPDGSIKQNAFIHDRKVFCFGNSALNGSSLFSNNETNHLPDG